ncbi:hypothetical protein [Roseateles sp.]|uniref:beta family protein n=1 Tax=Roseateles sp. TaxID=1971397 RepID=UPI0031E409D8
MIDWPLEDIVYFPALRTRPPELRALRELDKLRKSRMLPLMSLMALPDGPPDLKRAARRAAEVMQGLPHLIELPPSNERGGDRDELLPRLLDPSDGFRAWREFAAGCRQAVPVVQLAEHRVGRVVDREAERETARQARAIEEDFGLVVFRVRGRWARLEPVLAALRTMKTPERAVVMVDLGIERDWLLGCAGIARDMLDQLWTASPSSRLVVMGNSFPAQPRGANGAQAAIGSRLPILERELHRRLGGMPSLGYGDHASVHAADLVEPELPRGHGRVDYARDSEWLCERGRADSNDAAHTRAAQAIVDAVPELGERGVWGEHEIVEAANGRLYAQGRAAWTAVRVNLHLAAQVDAASRNQSADCKIQADPGEASLVQVMAERGTGV